MAIEETYTEYGIRIPSGGVLNPTPSRGEALERLDRYRDTWPTATLVERIVECHGWTESTPNTPGRQHP